MKLQILLVLLVCLCSVEIEARRRGRVGQRRFPGFFGRRPQNFAYTLQIRNTLVEENFEISPVTINRRGSLLAALVQVANSNSAFLFTTEYTATGFKIIKLNNLENLAPNNWRLTRNNVAVTDSKLSHVPNHTKINFPRQGTRSIDCSICPEQAKQPIELHLAFHGYVAKNLIGCLAYSGQMEQSIERAQGVKQYRVLVSLPFSSLN